MNLVQGGDSQCYLKMIKLNEIVSNYKLYSALEQFEVLTLLQCPELGFFGFILFIFLPRIFVTNLNLFIILTFTYLFGFFDLKKMLYLIMSLMHCQHQKSVMIYQLKLCFLHT
jgi:hypothetical protein